MNYCPGNAVDRAGLPPEGISQEVEQPFRYLADSCLFTHAGPRRAAVQMIDTSIIRVHQHAACIARCFRKRHQAKPAK